MSSEEIIVKDKKGYKLTKLGWIPEEWEFVSFKTLIIKANQGVNTTTEKVQYSKEGIEVIRSNNISEGKISFSDLTYVNEETYHRLSDNCKPKYGDILYCNIGSALGSACVFNYTRNVLINWNVLRIQNIKGKIDTFFFMIILNYYRGYLRKFATESTMPFISSKEIFNKKFPLPPLPEQKKIAEILSAWDDAISKTEQLITKKQERKKGLMQELLTGKRRFKEFVKSDKMKETKLGLIPEDWSTGKLSNYVDKIGSGITPKGGNEVYLRNGIPLIRSQNVLAGKLSLDDVVYISKEQHEIMKNTKLKVGDVLLNITGASIGRSTVVPIELHQGNVNQHVCIIRLKSHLHEYYLSMFLNSVIGQKQIMSFQAGGNREGLNFQQIKSFYIPIPPLQEQQKIASVLSEADQEIERLQNQLAKLREQKKGLMQKLLTGEVRVKVE